MHFTIEINDADALTIKNDAPASPLILGHTLEYSSLPNLPIKEVSFF
jgi:hypothetical protein